MCKHILSICIALKKVGNKLPPAAKNVPVGVTIKPDRPRLAVLALLKQPQFRSLTDYKDESSFNCAAPSYVAVEEEEEEEVTQILTQASTTHAVLAKKRGRGLFLIRLFVNLKKKT